MVKINLNGICKAVELTPNNGRPRLCLIRVELDHNVARNFRTHDIQLMVPAEFAGLMDVNFPVTVTLEQNGV